MKKRILKIGVILLLVAVVIAAGVAPLASTQAAAKKTTYTVVLQKGSLGISLISIGDGGVIPSVSDYEGTSFKIMVEEKAKKEKGASYYPVTILAKGSKFPINEQKMPGGTTSVTGTVMKGDSKGKLYLSGGDVDVSSVMNEKKIVTKIGDGKADAANSLVITLNCLVTAKTKETGKSYLKMPMKLTFTTGTNNIAVKGAKGLLETKALPENDTLKMLPKPLVGEPLDLTAGTGTLVGSSGATNLKTGIGSLDWITGIIWLMKITN